LWMTAGNSPQLPSEQSDDGYILDRIWRFVGEADVDLEPMAEALEDRVDRAILRLAALELGAALAVKVPEQGLTRLDGALNRGEGTLEPYDQGLRDGVRAVISGALQARQTAALRAAEEAAAGEEALRPLRGQILEHLKPAQVFRPGQVAKVLRKDPSPVGKELQAMCAEGLLLEQQFEDQGAVDRRGTYYRLSEKGIHQKEKRERRPGGRTIQPSGSEVVFVGLRSITDQEWVPVLINGRVQRFSQQVRFSSAPCSVFALHANPTPALAPVAPAGHSLEEE